MKLSQLLSAAILAMPLAYTSANDTDSKKVHSITGDVKHQLRGIIRTTGIAIESDSLVKEAPQDSNDSIWNRYKKLEKVR